MAYFNDKDNQNEIEVANWLSRCWKCEIKRFGTLNGIDWYIEKHERLIAIAELRCRPYSYAKYPNAFMDISKWSMLICSGLGLSVPALYIVRYSDQVRWIEVRNIDATKHTITGRRDRKPSGIVGNAVRPAIIIPVNQMVPVTENG